MKKLLYLLTCVIMLIALLVVSASAEILSGECGANGDNVTYTLDTETGLLTISGEGEMKDYFFNTSPWHDKRDTIKSITIEKGVRSIGEYCFYNCANITDITLPDSVIDIGLLALGNCSNLKSVTVPDSVKHINRSFQGCSSIESMKLPFIGQSPYENRYLAYIFGSVSVDGATYVPSSLKEIIISDECEIIGKLAFDNCSNLTNITIGNNVTSIGEFAFKGCRNITTITIPKGVTSILQSTFDCCSSLKTISIPTTVTTIERHAFAGCSSLSTVYYQGTQAKWDAINIYEEATANAPLLDADLIFIPKMTTTADAGYYAKSANAAEKIGNIVFNVLFENYDASDIESFGIYIYNESMVQKANVTSTNKKLLAENDGKVNVTIGNIPFANFDSRVLAMPYAVVNGETICGEICTFSVNDSLKWLGEKK